MEFPLSSLDPPLPELYKSLKKPLSAVLKDKVENNCQKSVN